MLKQRKRKCAISVHKEIIHRRVSPTPNAQTGLPNLFLDPSFNKTVPCWPRVWPLRVRHHSPPCHRGFRVSPPLATPPFRPSDGHRLRRGGSWSLAVGLACSAMLSPALLLLLLLTAAAPPMSESAAAGPHIADLTVLLPPRLSNPVEYRLLGSDGCFSW